MNNNLHLSSNDLATIVDALQLPYSGRPFPQQLWSTIRQHQWVRLVDIADLITAMDPRCERINLARLAEAADLPAREVHQLPRNPREQTLVTSRLALSDLGALCILLDRLGFCVGASEIARDLSAGIQEGSVVTIAQGALFWFEHKRHKGKLTIQATCSDGSTGMLPDIKFESLRWKGTAGHRYECRILADRIIAITVRERNFRAQRLKPTTCLACGFAYTLGDHDSVLEHRSVHAMARKVLSPRPTKRMRDRLKLGPRAERVDSESPLWMHHEVYVRAEAFHQELGYDHVQWPIARPLRSAHPGWVGYVLADTMGAIDGACAFYNRAGRWSMQWVWVRPGRRRHGILAARWQHFLNEFGDFEIEAPFSPSMCAFFEALGSPLQKSLLQALHQGDIPISATKK